MVFSRSKILYLVAAPIHKANMNAVTRVACHRGESVGGQSDEAMRRNSEAPASEGQHGSLEHAVLHVHDKKHSEVCFWFAKRQVFFEPEFAKVCCLGGSWVRANCYASERFGVLLTRASDLIHRRSLNTKPKLFGARWRYGSLVASFCVGWRRRWIRCCPISCRSSFASWEGTIWPTQSVGLRACTIQGRNGSSHFGMISTLCVRLTRRSWINIHLGKTNLWSRHRAWPGRFPLCSSPGGLVRGSGLAVDPQPPLNKGWLCWARGTAGIRGGMFLRFAVNSEGKLLVSDSVPDLTEGFARRHDHEAVQCMCRLQVEQTFCPSVWTLHQCYWVWEDLGVGGARCPLWQLGGLSRDDRPQTPAVVRLWPS